MLVSTAQAADTTLTLACKGTSTFKVKGTAKTEPLQIGIVVDLAKRTIRGLLLDTSETVPINDFTDLSIEFGGAFPSGSLSASMYGSLDRVTGDYLATEFYRNGASVELLHRAALRTSAVLACISSRSPWPENELMTRLAV